MNKSKVIKYLILWFVVIVWGLSPLVNVYEYKFYSPTIFTACSALISTISLLIICRQKLKLINKEYLLVAGITGIFNSLATILQKIGLNYTTPTQYAFLENLSCVVVPILVFILAKKRSGWLKILASVLCLLGSFILSGMNFSTNSISFGKGEILCALAGILYGVNIAVTGLYAKKLYAPLYVTIQMCIHTVMSFITALSLNFISLNGKIIEPIVFSLNILPVFGLLGLALISNTLCWILRTNVMKSLDPTVVSVIMPFSAVVTAVFSIIFKLDSITLNLILGASISFVAIMLSTLGDIMENKKL